jgi:hypothetical protein
MGICFIQTSSPLKPLTKPIPKPDTTAAEIEMKEDTMSWQFETNSSPRSSNENRTVSDSSSKLPITIGREMFVAEVLEVSRLDAPYDELFDDGEDMDENWIDPCDDEVDDEELNEEEVKELLEASFTSMATSTINDSSMDETMEEHNNSVYDPIYQPGENPFPNDSFTPHFMWMIENDTKYFTGLPTFKV